MLELSKNSYRATHFNGKAITICCCNNPIISIKTIDGKTAEGTLIEASEFEVRIKGKEKGRKIEAETVLIPFEQITETRVLISFK